MTHIKFKNLSINDDDIQFQVVFDNTMYENLTLYDIRKEPGFHVAKGLRFLLGTSNYQISKKDCKDDFTVYNCKIAICGHQFSAKELFRVAAFIFDDTTYDDCYNRIRRVLVVSEVGPDGLIGQFSYNDPRRYDVPYMVQLLTSYMRTYGSGKHTVPISNKSVAFSKDEFLAPVATQVPLYFIHYIYSDIINSALFVSRENAGQCQLKAFLHATKDEVVATVMTILANDAAEREEDQQSMATYQTVFTHTEGAAEALESSSKFRK